MAGADSTQGASAGAGRKARRGGGDSGDGGGGRCVRSVARSAAEARGPQCARRPPAPAAPPPVWGPARGPRGGASLLAAPRSTPGLASAPSVDLPASYRLVRIPVPTRFPCLLAHPPRGQTLPPPPNFVREIFMFYSLILSLTMPSRGSSVPLVSQLPFEL